MPERSSTRPRDGRWVEAQALSSPSGLVAWWVVRHGLSDPNPFPRINLFRRTPRT